MSYKTNHSADANLQGSLMKVGALIVTYGERASYLREVVESCIVEECDSILIINNAASELSRTYLNELTCRHDNIKVVHQPTNTGSSGGFSTGIKLYCDEYDVDYIWCLDDDNVPTPGALKALKDTSALLALDYGKEVILFSYRGTFDLDHALAVETGVIKTPAPHFWEILCFQLKKLRLKSVCNYPLVRTEVGPYGGMFISTELIPSIGLPDPRFFVYGDDFEYTYRATQHGYSSFVVYSSKIVDIDKKPGNTSRYYGRDLTRVKLFYGTRNHILLRKRVADSRALLITDLIAFSIYVTLSIIRNVVLGNWRAIQDLAVVYCAIWDGLREDFSRKPDTTL